jgi:K(+)-stimulated pyrophosphate-energized sodium pump
MFRVLAQEGGPLEVTFGSFENTWLWIVLAISLVALAFAWYLRAKVLAEGEGTDKMREIATAIQEGAKAYLRRQFSTLSIFLGILTVVLFFALPVSDAVTTTLLGMSPELSIRVGRSIAFLLGAGASMLTGYAGMWLAVRANVRTANAAKESGLRKRDRSAPGGSRGCSPWGSGSSARP